MSKTPYLLSFNTQTNPDNISLPNIDSFLLEDKNSSRIIIGYDWFSPGSYEMGIFSIQNNKIIPLSKCKGVSLVNEDGNWIFEESGFGHKGLIAFQVPDDLFCFVFNQDINSFTGDTVNELFFEENANPALIAEAIRLTMTSSNGETLPNTTTIINHDKLNLTFNEYLDLLNNPAVSGY